jgi:lysozyme family protein
MTTMETDVAFQAAFRELIGEEGGYVFNPADPGGETKYGISKRSYPNLNIKELTLDLAKAIYYRDFWLPLGDHASLAVRLEVFDFAVNSGIQTAIRKLQSAIGVADDGHFGPVSRAKLASMPSGNVVLRYLSERLAFMASLSTWPHFGRGWARRIARRMQRASDSV